MPAFPAAWRRQTYVAAAPRPRGSSPRPYRFRCNTVGANFTPFRIYRNFTFIVTSDPPSAIASFIFHSIFGRGSSRSIDPSETTFSCPLRAQHTVRPSPYGGRGSFNPQMSTHSCWILWHLLVTADGLCDEAKSTSRPPMGLPTLPTRTLLIEVLV